MISFKEYLNEISFGKDKKATKSHWDELSKEEQSKWLDSDGNMWLYSKNLTSFDDLPFILPGVWDKGFYCRSNNLTTLEGAPKVVGGNFNCTDNKLTTLKGAPEKVGGFFDCANNNLTTLEGAPEKVKGSFGCRYNKLTTLRGAPREVDGTFNCANNPTKFTREDVEKVCNVKMGTDVL